ncbi:MAG: hypothetical protein HRF43_00025 [Phycisphaerae bacterium]|jgi:hypothetical protein
MSGWTSLFKRSPKLKADPVIRWFGKMPATREYNDYYRSANEPWMGEFNEEWLIRGYEIYGQRVRNGPGGRSAGKDRIPVSSCILRLPKSGMTVLSAILDFGGDTLGRPFPMCFYVGLPTADWPGPTSDRIWEALGILRQLVGIQREVARFLNDPGQKKPEQFSAMFRDRAMSLERAVEPDGDAWLPRARSVSMSDWFAASDGHLGAGDVGSWMAMADRWGARIAEAESEDFEATLSFPIVAGVPQEVQVAGWVRWLEGRMHLGRRAVSMMWTEPAASRPARLSVIARELMPEDFLLLTPLVSELNFVDDLAGLRQEPGVDGSALPAGPSSWADFVQSRAKLTA